MGKSVDVLKSNMTASKPSANMLWGGRFTGGLDPLMVSYNESIYFDRAIYAQDIRGSIAYARANAKIGILTQDEFEAIEKGFGQVLSEWQDDKFEIKPGVDEDIHTANERRLGEIIGTQIAGKLHTAPHRLVARNHFSSSIRDLRPDARVHPPAAGTAHSLVTLAVELWYRLHFRPRTFARSYQTGQSLSARFGSSGGKPVRHRP